MFYKVEEITVTGTQQSEQGVTLEGDEIRKREPDHAKTLTKSNSQLYGKQLEHFK